MFLYEAYKQIDYAVNGKAHITSYSDKKRDHYVSRSGNANCGDSDSEGSDGSSNDDIDAIDRLVANLDLVNCEADRKKLLAFYTPQWLTDSSSLVRRDEDEWTMGV